MVKKFFALGPVATVGHIESPIKYLAFFSPEIEVLNITMFNLLLFILTNFGTKHWGTCDRDMEREHAPSVGLRRRHVVGRK